MKFLARMVVALGVIAGLAIFFINDSRSSVAAAPGCVDVSGMWEVNSKIDPGTCDEEIDPVQLTGEMKQTGCNVTFDIGVDLDGTVKGNRVYLKGDYWWMGTVTKDIELVVNGNSLTGKGKWTYGILGYSCHGTEVFQGRKKS